MSEEKIKKDEIDKKTLRKKRVKMRRIRFWALAGIIVAASVTGISAFILFQQEVEGSQTELIVYCGAGMREPMEDIAEDFEDEYGIKIKYTFGGSNTLLSQIDLYQEGDVYMPGATSYLDSAEDKGYIDKKEQIAYHIPVIAVPQGNPAAITDLTDFAACDSVVFGDPEACAIGKLGKSILEDNGTDWVDFLNNNVISTAATVNELVFWIAQEQGNASIIWKSSLLGTEDKTDAIEIHEDFNKIKIIPIGTLEFSEEKEAAEKFIDYVASDGKKTFADHGFEVYDGSESSSSHTSLFKIDYQYSKETLSLKQQSGLILDFNGPLSTDFTYDISTIIKNWIGL